MGTNKAVIISNPVSYKPLKREYFFDQNPNKQTNTIKIRNDKNLSKLLIVNIFHLQISFL